MFPLQWLIYAEKFEFVEYNIICCDGIVLKNRPNDTLWFNGNMLMTDTTYNTTITKLYGKLISSLNSIIL